MFWLLLEPAQAQVQPRIRTTGVMTFYAAPNGIDLNNNCLIESAPCTPQGAHRQAQFNYDYGDGGVCIIKMGAGTYINADGFMRISGQLVGRHACLVYGRV
jgi:hypothetical protein